MPKVDTKTGALKVKDDSKKCDDDAEADAWQTAMMNVIFLTFLGYESAREAISSLVEYQPARTERLIVILLTELRCFAFLRQHFHPEDLRGQRLQIRVADYKEQVVAIYDEVMSPHGKNEGDWLQAQKTIQHWRAGTRRRSARIWLKRANRGASAAGGTKTPKVVVRRNVPSGAQRPDWNIRLRSFALRTRAASKTSQDYGPSTTR